MAVGDRVGVPDGEGYVALVEDPCGIWGAEWAGWRSLIAPGGGEICIRPGSPASRHSAHRQLGMGRRAVRVVWQTGQRCSKVSDMGAPAAGAESGAVGAGGAVGAEPGPGRFGAKPAGALVRAWNPAFWTRAAHSGPWGRASRPCCR